MNRIDILTELWHAFGKPLHKEQLRIYGLWAKGLSPVDLKTVVDHWVDNNQRFPSLNELKCLYKSIIGRKNTVYHSENPCYWCQDTGYVPVINAPDNKSTLFYQVMYSCKCSNRVARIPLFHNYFPTGQLISPPKDGIQMYPQLVQQLSYELNEKKHINGEENHEKFINLKAA